MAGGALTFYGVAKMQSAMLEGESLSLLSLLSSSSSSRILR